MAFLLSACSVADERADDTLPRPVRSLALPAVHGRIDHLAFDAASGRLFVACVGAGRLEVLDLAAGSHVGSVGDLREPQGVAVVPGRDGAAARVWVACGGDGMVRVFDAVTLQPVGAVAAGDDADNVHVDLSARRVHVGCGDGSVGAVVAIDADTLAVVGRAALPGHAEGFQLEPDGARLFVNVPGASAVVVADRRTGATAATWPLRDAANFPLACVAEQDLVLTVCRRPPSVLLALDRRTGTELACTPCIDDADDLFFDAASDRAFVIGGGRGGANGAIEVFALPAHAQFRRLGVVPLPPRTRTGLLVSERRQLYVAVPAPGDGGTAEVREFALDAPRR